MPSGRNCIVLSCNVEHFCFLQPPDFLQYHFCRLVLRFFFFFFLFNCTTLMVLFFYNYLNQESSFLQIINIQSIFFKAQ